MIHPHKSTSYPPGPLNLSVLHWNILFRHIFSSPLSAPYMSPFTGFLSFPLYHFSTVHHIAFLYPCFFSVLPLDFSAYSPRGSCLLLLWCHYHCHGGVMELHTPGGAESQKRRPASLFVSDRVSCCLAAGVSNILKVSLSTMLRIDFHVLLFLHLERLICKAKEWVVLY